MFVYEAFKNYKGKSVIRKSLILQILSEVVVLSKAKGLRVTQVVNRTRLSFMLDKLTILTSLI